jgi:hypothetical protein
MKLSLDCTFPPNLAGTRIAVPIKFVRIGSGVMDKLAEQLQTYRYDNHIELIKVKFTGGENMAFMIVAAIVSVHLFDLRADSKQTVEYETILDLEKTVAADAIANTASMVGEQVNAAIHSILEMCGAKKLRFMSGHKIIEPA